MFRIALIQMRVEPGAKEANLSRAEALTAQAAQNGARVVVLPEALTTGWTDPSARLLADEIPHGPGCVRLRDLARRHGLFLCAGLIERSGDVLFNAAILADPAGEILLHHRKLNELEIGHDLYAQGDRLAVARTELGTFGVMICADAFARGQVASRALGLMGADMILSPSAWAVPAGHDNTREPYGSLWVENYAPVARDFRLWIAGVSNVGPIHSGPWRGRKCIGCSLLMNARGQVVTQGPYGEDAESILYAEVELTPRPARGGGWETIWSPLPQRANPTGEGAAC